MSLVCSSSNPSNIDSQVSFDVSEYGGPRQGPPPTPTSTLNRSSLGPARTTPKGLYSGLHEDDELETDYDRGATELYKRIEGKDWDGALSRLDKAPREAKTWVSRREYNSNSLRWRLLPIHATCIFRSPLALMEALIATYPDGAQMKDDQVSTVTL
jgi:hypothetical protein